MDIGAELKQLKKSMIGMSSQDKGWSIGNSQLIKEAHNSFMSDSFVLDKYEITTKKDDDAFHLIAYVPYGG